MTFETPWILLLAPVLLAALAPLARRQLEALQEIDLHCAPRFRSVLTTHDRKSLIRHLLFLGVLLMLLIGAGAHPSLPGSERGVAGAVRLVLLLDASTSMWATDVESMTWLADASGELPRHRLEAARRLAGEVLRDLDSPEVALVSFSGTTTLHLPLTGDAAAIEGALATLEAHNYYRATGSSLSGALDELFHFAEDGEDLQVLLIGDGELPFEESYDGQLEALQARGVAVHAVTIGSEEGQPRRILRFADVVNKVEEPEILLEFTTRRVDEHYRRIARATGGEFEVASQRTAGRVAEAIEEFEAPARGGESAGERRDISHWFLAAFLLGTLIEAWWIGRPSRPTSFEFDPRRLGDGALLLVLVLLTACSDSLLERAHRANEEGIAADNARLFEPARRLFERSLAFDIQPEVPTYNLGRSRIRSGHPAEAREALQKAVELAPEFHEAYYNDGHALFALGEAERDPRGCDLERTRDLWQAARDRFRLVVARAVGKPDLVADARENLRYLLQELAQIEALIAEPPPECLDDGGEPPPPSPQAPPDPPPGGGAAPSEPPPPGGSGSPPPTPDGGGSGPLDDEERQQIADALDRIRQQGFGEGRYHRRTVPEQFPASVWANPDEVLWW